MSENTPLNSVNVINVSTPLLINRKRISVYQALFLCAGYQASPAHAPPHDRVRSGNETRSGMPQFIPTSYNLWPYIFNSPSNTLLLLLLLLFVVDNVAVLLLWNTTFHLMNICILEIIAYLSSCGSTNWYSNNWLDFLSRYLTYIF